MRAFAVTAERVSVAASPRWKPSAARLSTAASTSAPLLRSVTAVLSDARCVDHGASDHPEQPDRVAKTLSALKAAFGTAHGKVRFVDHVTLAPENAVLAVHSKAQVKRLEALGLEASKASTCSVNLDSDTLVTSGTLQACLAAAGAVVDAVDLVFDPAGDVQNAFCLVRPPGHHATSKESMGFCMLNNVAIGARHAQREHGAQRVAIVDFDVHHGNGTQDVFWDDRTVLFVSTHQQAIYPNSGDVEERGAHGNVINVPLPSMFGPEEYRDVLDQLVLPAVASFKPDLIMVSAGFDSHRDDPLGSLLLTEREFVYCVRMLRAIAEEHCGGRLVSVLEGGYNLAALARCCTTHVAELAGLPFERSVGAV